jgi:hypothetical protein
MSFAVASTEERDVLDDALIASFSRRYRAKAKGQSDGTKYSFKPAAAYL